MAFSVYLKLGEYEKSFGSNDNKFNQVAAFPIKRYICHYDRTYNAMTPNASPRCSGIEVVLDTPLLSQPNLTEWYISNLAMSGKLVVCYTGKSGRKEYDDEEIRVIAEFEDAVCHYFGEEYSDDTPRLITLRFDPKSVITNQIRFDHL